MEKIKIRGLYFDNVTMSEALAFAERALATDRGVCVFTPNAEIAQLAIENEEIMRLLNSADLLLPDGAGILLASEILKTPLAEKVAGVDFGLGVLSLAAQKEIPAFLLGGKPSIAATAAKKLNRRLPALKIVGTHDGYFEKKGAANDDVIKQINAVGAQILFVCFGAPMQEKWIAENKHRLPSVRLFAGLGGSLDVYAETVRRAPDFFIKTRLEWFYRLLQEPKRFRRMIKLPKYILGAFGERIFRK